MRLAVISDIHANIEAFQAVFHDLEHRTDSILNLGDLVGYNASPNECVEMARDIGMHSIQGNHDQAACNLDIAESFNIYARKAILWTRNALSEDNIRFLNGLSKSSNLTCGLACHGSPESTSSYIELHFQARATLKMMKKGFWGKTNVCFFGHTHCQGIFSQKGPQAPGKDGLFTLEEGELFFVNPGSVGQPRDGNARAAFAIYDTERRTVELIRVDYDKKTTAEKISQAGLPMFLAERLMMGR